MKFFALLAVASAVSINAPYTAGDGTLADEASSNPTVEDRTGTYSPKANMWTGFEGTKTGNAYTYTYDTTGTHPSVVRLPSNSNFRNAVNEGSAHQRAN